MKSFVNIRFSSRLLLILLWLAACAPSVPATDAPIDLLTPIHVLQTPMPLPSQTISATLTSIPTQSPTNLPSLTLPLDQIVGNAVELLKTNSGCQLPCVWGITPGNTSWIEAEKQLQKAGLTLSADPQGVSLVHYESLLIPATTVDEGMFTQIEFTEQNGVVTAIHLEGDGYYSPSEFRKIWINYAPERIVPNLGSPTRVWIKAVASAAEGSPTSFPYELWLFYDPLGLLLRYSGTVDAGPIYKICPTFSDSGNIGDAIDVYAVAIGGNTSPEDLTELDTMPYPPLSLEYATGMTIEEFYTLFLQNGKPICIESPRNIWK